MRRPCRIHGFTHVSFGLSPGLQRKQGWGFRADTHGEHKGKILVEIYESFTYMYQVFGVDGFVLIFMFCLRHKADKPTPKHKRRLITWQVFCQVERRFHSREMPTSSLRFGYLPTIIIQEFRVVVDWELMDLNVNDPRWTSKSVWPQWTYLCKEGSNDDHCSNTTVFKEVILKLEIRWKH